MTSSIANVKRAQKESLLFREISQLFMRAGQDDPKLQSVTINRVSLSHDKGMCTVYCYTPDGQEQFTKELLPILMQYKPSLRKALAARIKSRYTPDLKFAFDAQFEKQLRLEQLIEGVKGTIKEDEE